MSNFVSSKKVVATALCLVLIAAMSHANNDNIDCCSKRVQVLINANDPTFQFCLNVGGGGLQCGNPFVFRPFGANYLLNGLLFPGGTIDPSQPDYTKDKHGNPLSSANSIGQWLCAANSVLLLSLPNLPAIPTLAELIHWDFFINHGTGLNAVFTYGEATTGVNVPGQPFFTVRNVVEGGVGPNRGKGGNLKATVYFQASTFSLLIDVIFDEEISLCS